MNHIFHSLGSNYSFSFSMYALKLAFFGAASSAVDALTKHFEASFHGTAYCVNKGRTAITVALQALGLDGDEVLTQAFSCYAVEEGIVQAKCIPIYVDIEKETVNVSVATLNAALAQHPQAKAVIIQHTLGNPAPIQMIRSWCTKHHILLIEDLAQAIGGKDENNEPLGAHADAIILSFGRDKVFDVGMGGIAIVRNEKKHITINEKSSQAIVKRNLLYPICSWLIRHTYAISVGKSLHWLLKKTTIFQSPIVTEELGIRSISPEHAVLALHEISNLSKHLTHRKQCASIYAQELSNVAAISPSTIQRASNQRFSIFVEKPNEVAAFLAEKNIHLSDRWYREAVDSGSLHLPTVYKQGSCPNAEWIAQHIFQVPTHPEISSHDAHSIAKELNTCLKQ